MEDKKLEDYRNERIRSICSIIENRRNEVACKIYLVLTEEPQGTNKLSQPAMNFLFGRKYVDFMDRKNRLQQSADVAKYIRRNNLLSKTDELLAKK